MTASSSNSNNIHQSLGGGNSSQPPSKASSPASPTASFQTQQVPPSRSFINLKSSGRPTLNGSSFPVTPTSERSNTTIASTNTPPTSALDPPPGTTYADFIRIWSDAHVARWLTDIKCGSHASTFKNNDIRGDVLLELDQVTLKEMGINSIGDRFRIVNAVKVLRQRCSTRSTLSLPLFDVTHPRGYDGIGGRGESLSISSYGQPITHNRSDSLTETSPSIRRRLENGRPPPLHLNSTTTRSDLPRLVNDGLDSAKSGHHAFRSLPQHPQSPSSNTPSSSTRPGLPPPVPPPRTHPPPPPLPLPLGPGNRSTPGRLQPSNNQRSRTPTQPDPPSYVNMPLPPAPGPAGQQQNSMTPTTATSQGSSSGNWSGSGSGYGLPPDPRPGGKVLVRNPVGTRSPNPNAAHHRNMSFAGVNSPLATTPTSKARPNTANTNSSSHPYASETARSQALQAPTPAQLQAMSLSPIAESFVSTRPGSPSPPTPFTVGRGPFTTTRPMTPSHAAAPSLDDLRRKLVRFLLPEEGHSCTINAEDCSGGIEVLEKVLKKFNKLGSGDRDIMDLVEIGNGGLSVDGWGVYLDWGQGDGLGESLALDFFFEFISLLWFDVGKPLTEAELLSICHAPPDNPARERGLTLRRSTKSKRPKALGQWLGGNNQRANSPTSPTILPTGEPDRDGNLLSPHHANANKSFEEGQTKAMNTKRASSISILSGLGVPYPEKALEPSSPTTSTGGRKSPASNHKRPSKLRNFFGQRPPSELITTHLAEYFPFTEKKVLERTARNSMMRSSTIGSIGKRDSTMSWNPALPLSSSRFSSSTQGDVGSISPRTSFSSIAPPPVPDKTSPFTGERTPVTEEPPRMSLSTDDGRSIDLDPEESEKPPRLNSIPQLLPPVNISSESFSESIENLTGGRRRSRPASGAFSIASKRMSYMTELRSKRDVSDTASLVTVDEITASVESRRESMAIDRGTDSADEWTKIGSDEDTNVADSSEQTAVEDDYTSEEYESDEQDALSEDDDDCGPGKAVTSKGGKYISFLLLAVGTWLHPFVSRNEMDQGCSYWSWLVWKSVFGDGRFQRSAYGRQTSRAPNGLCSQRRTQEEHA